MLKCWNHSTTTRNYAVTKYKTWQLGLKNTNDKNFQKTWKNRSSEQSHKKKTDRTNIIDTNFVWEQLNTLQIIILDILLLSSVFVMFT